MPINSLSVQSKRFTTNLSYEQSFFDQTVLVTLECYPKDNKIHVRWIAFKVLI